MSDQPDITPVVLIDAEKGTAVNAELWYEIADKNLTDWVAEWRPETRRQLASLRAENVEPALWPQSAHWNWVQKAAAIEGQLDAISFAVVADGMTQGMMTLDASHRSRVSDRRTDHILYVEFLEVAPWHRPEAAGTRRRMKGIGSILMRAAIERSKIEGFKGRIGLHSLPQSNDFYGNVCGMTDFGADPDYSHELRYFEMDEEAAARFLERGKT
ncbi:GNAT family N-acetyltransferase [Parvularcula oceani]|uniref:GNAT family N-acetyltransferase n=1 Tax=Parvularcula oceani TaxID=1247963 RepID=UPI0004E12D09|nr:GNAT family N-acetyltransferase [Parvularcula oceani]